MKVAFFHDTPIFKGNVDEYYSVGFPYQLWKRYLTFSNKLIVVARGRDISNLTDKQKNGLKLSSGNDVSFELVEGYSNPRQLLLLRKKVRNVLLSVDRVIIRLPSVVGLVACREAIRLNVPFAIEVVGCTFDALWNFGTFKAKILSVPMFILNRYYIGKSSYTIYVTKEFLQKRYPSKGIYYGVSDVEIKLLDENVLKNRKEKISKLTPDDTVTFGLIGSLDVNYKGHKTAFKALALLSNRIKFRLKLLGTGSEKRWIKLAKELNIQDSIEFSGTLPSGTEVFKWMDSLDIFLIPSLAEGLPRALVEAMSRALPAIGARTGGIMELISTDFIHKKKNHQELADLIVKMCNNQQIMCEQAQKNYDTSRKFTARILDQERMNFWNAFFDGA